VSRGLILAIESSCDETAAAVVERGARTLSSVVASQISTHARYGGVVPELASREHLRAIVPVVRAALAQANTTLANLDAIAVTSGPGLAGALLVGITYAKALAFANNLPLIGVNHLEGHIHAVLLNEKEHDVPASRRTVGQGFSPDIDPVKTSRALAPEVSSSQPAPYENDPEPALALVVSGGHTHLYLATPTSGSWHYTLIGRTLDDAAGEAFDKVAKLLGLGYPGGPWIDALAQHGNPHAVPFAFSQFKPKLRLSRELPRTKAAKTAPIANLNPHFLFSFSGIKTAVLRYVELHNLRPEAESRRETLFTGPDAQGNSKRSISFQGDLAAGERESTHVRPARSGPTIEAALATLDPQTLDLIASFQHAVVGDLLKKTFAAAESLSIPRILVTGGVAANRELRQRFTAEATRRHVSVSFPTLALSTDNAAMIAAAAWPRFLAQDFAPPNLSADPSLALG